MHLSPCLREEEQDELLNVEMTKTPKKLEYNEGEEFDDFASNPTNIIINGINTFEETDVASVICNKYRLENINVEIADLDEDNIPALINKIDFIIRINKIENSDSSIEKIWFIVENNQIKEKEEKEKK